MIYYPNKRTSGFKGRDTEHEIYRDAIKGEIVARDYIRLQGIPVEHKLSNTYTFWDLRYKGVTMDVKTRPDRPYVDCFLVPLTNGKYQRLTCNYYIGVQLPNTIHGYLTKAEVAKLPIDYKKKFGKNPARWCYYWEMHDIKYLINILKEVGK